MNFDKLRAEAQECKELSTTIRWPPDEILALLDELQNKVAVTCPWDAPLETTPCPKHGGMLSECPVDYSTFLREIVITYLRPAP